MLLTRKQREALFNVYRRGPDWFGRENYPESYMEFRRTVIPYLDGTGCVIVKAGFLWLGIEPDGYTHS